MKNPSYARMKNKWLEEEVFIIKSNQKRKNWKFKNAKHASRKPEQGTRQPVVAGDDESYKSKSYITVAVNQTTLKESVGTRNTYEITVM